jgi:hypothetical protein
LIYVCQTDDCKCGGSAHYWQRGYGANRRRRHHVRIADRIDRRDHRWLDRWRIDHWRLDDRRLDDRRLDNERLDDRRIHHGRLDDG